MQYARENGQFRGVSEQHEQLTTSYHNIPYTRLGIVVWLPHGLLLLAFLAFVFRRIAPDVLIVGGLERGPAERRRAFRCCTHAVHMRLCFIKYCLMWYADKIWMGHKMQGLDGGGWTLWSNFVKRSRYMYMTLNCMYLTRFVSARQTIPVNYRPGESICINDRT